MISPLAYVDPSAKIGENVTIHPFAYVDADTVIGDNTVIMPYASVIAGTTIGTLLSDGRAAATSAPHAILWPSIFLGLLMISFNLFGNGLRDAFNPTTKGEG